jgi:membrane fusion protein, heavy metal efflux system
MRTGEEIAMKTTQMMRPIVTVAVVAAMALGAYLTSQTWLPWIHQGEPVVATKPPYEAVAPSEKIIVSDQAQKNLGISAKYLKAEIFRKTISVPGIVVDRPGVSDRGIVSPVMAVVSAIHHVPGDTVRPGDVLFTLKPLSESLQLTQTDLVKTAQEIKLAQVKRKRLIGVSSAIPESRIIEVDSQITRLEIAARAYRQELLNRGLSDKDIDTVAEGMFISEIRVAAPPRMTGAQPLTVAAIAGAGENPIAGGPLAFVAPPRMAGTLPVARVAKPAEVPFAFEFQELKVEVGQQVQVGQALCILANHQSLSIKGRAFPDEIQLLERTFKERWPVQVDFQDDTAAGWDESKQTFFIRNIANNFDPVNRTFAFHLPLENQSRVIKHNDGTKLVWRYRPGQKVRLGVRVEEVKNVFVLPADAVVRDGAEAYVFTQNVNTFERKGVVVLFQERGHVVIANDGSLPTYAKDKEGSVTVPKEKETWTIPAVAQTAAAQLYRMGKAGSSGVPKGYHIHADGSLHKNEDEGK